MSVADERVLTAIGLMSGTSMDGIDAALLKTDGYQIAEIGPSFSVAYTPGERELLRQAVASAGSLAHRDDRSGVAGEAETMLTAKHADVVRSFMAKYGLTPADVNIIGFHGQTILHRPEKHYSIQIGDGGALADMTGIPVIYDFRGADMTEGGQGAPLVPLYHLARVIKSELPRPIAVVNLGGIANVTWIGQDRGLIAFDTGPGNALMDDWALRHTGSPMDADGHLAGTGNPVPNVLEMLLRHPFFSAKPPKSLDRHDFTLDAAGGLSPADGAATLAAFTAGGLILAQRFFPEAPLSWVLCGGGTRNPVLMAAVKQLLKGKVQIADELGWSSVSMEAEAFAFLAVRSLKRVPITFPSTTGVSYPLTGGRLVTPG
jgi:anhydro-N-acetylmuramic acid kinase